MMDRPGSANPTQSGLGRNLPDISKSTLSATAAVFVPRSFQVQPQPQAGPQVCQQQVYQPPYQPQQTFGHHQHQGGYSGYQGYQGYAGQGGQGGGYNRNRGGYNNRGRGRGGGYQSNRGGGGRGGYGGYHGHQADHTGQGPTGHNKFLAKQDPLELVQQAVKTLTANPGSFDEIMEPLNTSLAASVKHEQELQNIVEELFTQSVRETNFRYTGARMCNYFSHKLILTFPGGNFRQHLLKRCHEEHSKRDQLVQSPATTEHLVGFTLFMGELLLNMTVITSSQHAQVSDQNQTKIQVLATAVQELLNTHLDSDKDNCLKCVVQVLKLTGANLEEVEKGESASGKAEKLDLIFEKIKGILVQERLQSPSCRSLKAMLLSVVELRANEWGQKESPQNGSKQPNPYLDMDNQFGGPLQIDEDPFERNPFSDLPQWSNGTNFMPGGEGADMFWSGTEEEYYAYMMGAADDAHGDYMLPDNEFDDEIADAFEEFMRENDERNRSQMQ